MDIRVPHLLLQGYKSKVLSGVGRMPVDLELTAGQICRSSNALNTALSFGRWCVERGVETISRIPHAPSTPLLEVAEFLAPFRRAADAVRSCRSGHRRSDCRLPACRSPGNLGSGNRTEAGQVLLHGGASAILERTQLGS